MAVISQLSVSLTANTKGLERGFKKAKRKVNDFTKSIFNIKTAVASALGIGGIGAMVGDLVSVNAEMQRLKSGLKTVTGSSEAAATAFDKIRKFSTTTPFELNEVTNAFVKLKAYGLDPSERALTAYGNTASAMGKSLDQMIEAVADASTGEFERLKEFGIRASKQGDQVAFTFKGVTETVKLNSESIQGYLKRLSETNFGNAMSDQMSNLGPSFSNMRTAIQDLKVAIGEAGLNKAISTLVNNTTDWINSLDASKVKSWTQNTLSGIADLLDKTQSIFSYISGNKFLQYGGIVGFMLFGKWGVAGAAGLDALTNKIGDNLAKAWGEWNPSGVTFDSGGFGNPTSAPVMGGYNLGGFNDSGGNAQYMMLKDRLREKYGAQQIDEQKQTNGLLNDIADVLRENSTIAVAG